MHDCLSAIMDGFELPAGARQELDDAGFTVIPGPVPTDELGRLGAAYDAAITRAAPGDVKVGSSTTRVRDFVNRGPEFEALYLHPPVLKACCRIIDEPFRLSTMHARTLRPDAPAQDLHVDFERDSHGWTMAGFIFMVDEFRNDNGATRFVPGSHLWPAVPTDLLGDLKADYPGQVLACGPAGSMIVFNGSVWHGHTVNRSGQPRRSIQGAYVRRGAESGENLPARLLPATLSRIGPLAQYLLAAQPPQSRAGYS
jgi:ectoine hydroxylase-related dioxygenase (phytanoyl-CoA dioxygenase family)